MNQDVPKKMFRTPDAAQYLAVGQSTLERMRITGTGPRWHKLGARIVTYAIEDLDDWANNQVRMSTSEAA